MPSLQDADKQAFDEFDKAAVHKAVRGLMHTQLRHETDLVDQFKAIQSVIERVDSAERRIELCFAEVGQIRADVDAWQKQHVALHAKLNARLQQRLAKLEPTPEPVAAPVEERLGD